ncbi:hypothetical protein B0O80DRAFT_467380, partial [Mortierella sp. GBAus27b]
MALRELGDLTGHLSKSSAYSLRLLSIVPGTVFKNKKDPTTVMIQASMRPVNILWVESMNCVISYA